MSLKIRLLLAMGLVILIPLAALLALARLNGFNAVPGEPMLRYVRLNRTALELIEAVPGSPPTFNNPEKIPSWLGLAVFDLRGKLVDTNLDIDPSTIGDSRTATFMEFADLVRRDYPNRRYILEPIMVSGETVGSYLALFRERATVKMIGRDRPAWVLRAIALLFGGLILLSLGITFFIGRFGSSMLKLEAAADRISRGDLETAVRPEGAREIVSLGQAMERMRTALQEERERRIRFVAAVSHDLKTPLTAIIGYIEALQDRVATDAESTDRFLGIMKHKADLLDRRIADLLDFARVSTEDWRTRLEPVQLKPFIATLAKIHAADADSLGMKFEEEISVREAATVMLDRTLITRAIENVAANSLRYGSAGDTLRLKLAEEGDSYLLSLSDDGPGIKAADLDHVFEPYYRGTGSRREAGSGLGLYITYSIAQSHGWAVEVLSPPNQGTTVNFRIPKKVSTQGVYS